MTNSESPDSGLRPKFIVDMPAQQDKLGAHGRLARAIVDVVRHDKDVKTIGLLGGWGSGKSTVVTLVQQELEAPSSPPAIQCFTYDAWLHQSDKPRRAFLEALVAYLRREPAFTSVSELHGNAWQKAVDDLKHQVEENHSTTTPTLTKAGLWYLPTLLMVPIGLRLIGDGTMTWEAWHDWVRIAAFTIGWAFTTAPFLALVGIYFAWRPKLSIFSRAYWTTHRPTHDGQSILSIVANRQVEGKTERKSRSPDPSALEFQIAFRSIMATALASDRALVIVVDNLDRLPPDEAMATWATVRSFFLGSDGTNQRRDAVHLPTVIFPLDASAIAQIYGRRKAAGDEDRRDEESILSRSFVEKTFDLVFHVPAPVLSRWREYLRERLEAVFTSNMQEDWPPIVAAVYEAWLGNMKVPTPRSINTFVNDLAVAHLQAAGEDISIGVIAYYILNRPMREADFREVVRLAAAAGLDRFEPAWDVSIAALHYGVPRDDARELFMEGPIRSAIQLGDATGFAAAAASPGFESYLQRVLAAAIASQDELRVYNAARLLNDLDNASRPELRDAWRSLRALSISTMVAYPFSVADQQGLRALIARCDGAERPLYLRSLSKAFENFPAGELRQDQGEGYALGVRTVIEEARSVGLDDLNVTVPGGASSFTLMLVQDLPLDVLRAIMPSEPLPAVILHLQARLDDALGSSWGIRGAGVLARRNADAVDWSSLAEWTGQAFASDNISRIATAAALVRQLYEPTADFKVQVNGWRESGVLQRAFSVAWSQGQEAQLADVAAVALAARFNPTTPDGQSWDAKIGGFPDLPRAIEAALTDMGIAVDWDLLIAWGASAPFLLPLLQALASRVLRRDGASGPDVETLKNRAGILELLIAPQDRPLFWGRASQTSGFLQFLEQMPLAQGAPIYHAIMESEERKAALGKSLKSRLDTVPAEEWLAALREGAEPMGIVRALDTIKSAIVLGSTPSTVLRYSIDELLSDGSAEPRLRWFALADRLSPANRQTLFTLLADALTAGRPVTGLLQLMTTGGSALLEVDAFRKTADGAARHLILTLVDDPQGRSWLLSNAKHIAPLVARSDPSSRTTVGEALERHAREGDPVAKELLLQIFRSDSRGY